MPENLVVMGRVIGAHGVKGQLKVQPFSESPNALCSYPKWWIGMPGKWQQVDVLDATVHGVTVVARLAGIEDRDAASLLRYSEVAVPREALPATEADEYYWADLIGFSVMNEQEVVLGQVAGHLSTGAHDVMRVVDGETERLLPFVGAVIRKVDVAQRCIRVDWEADW